MYKRKKRIMKVLRKSVLTGKAVWIGHERSYKAEYMAYRRACRNEITRMRGWCYVVARRRNNILHLLQELTAHLPILGDIPPEQQEAARFLMQLANTEPPKQSEFYDHIREERRRREKARTRERRWKEKYGAKN